MSKALEAWARRFLVPSQEIEAKIIKNGGKISDTIKKSTTHLIAAEDGLASGKALTAVQKNINNSLSGGVFFICGCQQPQKIIQTTVIMNGGNFSESITNNVTHVISSADSLSSSQVQSAMERNLPIVCEDFLQGCIDSGGLLNLNLLKNKKYLLTTPNLPDAASDAPAQMPGSTENAKLANTASLQKQKDVFQGSVFALSGRFNTPQDKLKELITQHGGRTTESVAKNTTHLLSDGTPSSKVNEAAERNIPIVKETFVQACIESGHLIQLHFPEQRKCRLVHPDHQKIVVNMNKNVLDGMVFALNGRLYLEHEKALSQDEVKEIIHQAGGKTADSVTNTVTHLIASEVDFRLTTKMEAALMKEIPIVNESFIVQSLRDGELADLQLHTNYLLNHKAKVLCSYDFFGEWDAKDSEILSLRLETPKCLGLTLKDSETTKGVVVDRIHDDDGVVAAKFKVGDEIHRINCFIVFTAQEVALLFQNIFELGEELDFIIERFHKPRSKTKTARDPNMPKKPIKPFFFYKSAATSADFLDLNPGMGMGELTKKLSEQWRQLSDVQKEPYRRMAQEDKDRYAQEMALYKQQQLGTVPSSSKQALQAADKKQKPSKLAESATDCKEAETACLRCQKQHKRCSRELPCSRCLKAKKPCVYPHAKSTEHVDQEKRSVVHRPVKSSTGEKTCFDLSVESNVVLKKRKRKSQKCTVCGHDAFSKVYHRFENIEDASGKLKKTKICFCPENERIVKTRKPPKICGVCKNQKFSKEFSQYHVDPITNRFVPCSCPPQMRK